MWAAVRHYAGAADRVANNPLFMAEMTPWPVNISWALFANRASCFAGRSFPHSSLPYDRLGSIDEQFRRVFAGHGSADDVRDMITSDASVDDIRNFARTQGMTTLRESGLKLIFDGVTTIDEVVRETVMEDVE